MLTPSRARSSGRAPSRLVCMLLAAVALGLVTMHGPAVADHTSTGQHRWAPTPAAGAPVTTALLAGGQAAPDVSVAAHHVTEPADDAPSRGGDASALMMCMALLLAIGTAAAASRTRGHTLPARRAPRRLVLPPPPALRDRAPVPRFIVMRC